MLILVHSYNNLPINMRIYHMFVLHTYIIVRLSSFLTSSIETILPFASGAMRIGAKLFKSILSLKTMEKGKITCPAHSAAKTSCPQSKDEMKEIMALWPDIVKDLTQVSSLQDIPDVTSWFSKVLQYNVPHGKKNRAQTVVYAYRKLAPASELTEDNLRLARILGWCTELCQAFFLVEDDIMDHSEMRRGQKCWYLYNDIGLSAVNDGLLLEHAPFELLRIHFRGKPCYLNLVECYQENTMKTVLGQSLDLLSCQYGSKPNLSLFTMDRYSAIVKYKSAYYSFVVPVALAMYFAGITDPEMHTTAKNILMEMGHFFQVQDDYLDCYGDPQVTGKIGTDIQEGKCTWLAVIALQRFTPAQRNFFEECYGSNDPDKVAKIRKLYDDLELRKIYSNYEEETYNCIKSNIQASRGLPHEMFLKILSDYYRRNA